jgi:hypothetical protein
MTTSMLRLSIRLKLFPPYLKRVFLPASLKGENGTAKRVRRAQEKGAPLVRGT